MRPPTLAALGRLVSTALLAAAPAAAEVGGDSPLLSAYASLPTPASLLADAARVLTSPALLQQLPLLVLGLVVLVNAWRFLRPRGDLAISLQYPPELRGTFRVRVVRRPGRRRPAPTPREILEGGTSSPTRHHLVSRETHFQRLPARSYTVVVDGVLQDRQSDEVVETTIVRSRVRVRSRRTVRHEFDLCPKACPVDVRVLWDGRAPRDALVTARALPPRALHDAHRDRVRLALPMGSHLLLIGSGDRVVERSIRVDSFRPQRVEVDIAVAAEPIFKGCPPAVVPYLRGDIRAAAQALERDGQAERAQLLLAHMHREAGRDERAAEHFERAGRPDEAAALWVELGDLARAAALFEVTGELVQAAETWHRAGELVRAGEAYERARDFDHALECYRAAADMSKVVDVLDRRGDTFAAAQIALDNGWRARAIRLLRTLSPEDPHIAEACALLADVFEREGHWELAAHKLEEQIATFGPGRAPADLHARLAELVERAGNVEKALSVLEELRRREPTFPNVAARIELLHKKRSSARALGTERPLPQDFAATSFLSDSRYEILEEIGRGGMGVVFRARDRRLSRLVALKRLPESLKNYPQAVQLFLREAQATAGLNHRHIVTLYDADQEEGCFFITMELLEGEPLHRVLEGRGAGFPAAEVARFGCQVAEGLAFAHQRKVVHRDIKTANLFLCTDGTVKIMDFGLARTLEEVRRIETGLGGTPFYMAPEQILGEEVDPRSDLYSLGVTLYELATGGLPFPEGDVTYHHRHSPAPDPRERVAAIPEALAELIVQLLAKDPADRCASAGDVVERLARLQDV